MTKHKTTKKRVYELARLSHMELVKRITYLEAENEKLREALEAVRYLEEFAEICYEVQQALGEDVDDFSVASSDSAE